MITEVNAHVAYTTPIFAAGLPENTLIAVEGEHS